MTDTPRIRVTIAAPLERVWDALRDRERIRHWHGWEFDGGRDGSLDQEIETIYFTDVEVGEGVLHLNGGDRIALEEVHGATRVTLTRAARTGDAEWDAYYDDITEGWTTFLHQLRFAVERHPRGSRRTIVLRGRVAVDPLTALGPFPAEGDRYGVELPDGAASGTVWFRSPHQLGLSVDGWGDGLVILSHGPRTGSAMAVLSLYDLDAKRMDALDARWRSWWRERVAWSSDNQSSAPQSSNEP